MDNFIITDQQSLVDFSQEKNIEKFCLEKTAETREKLKKEFDSSRLIQIYEKAAGKSLCKFEDIYFRKVFKHKPMKTPIRLPNVLIKKVVKSNFRSDQNLPTWGLFARENIPKDMIIGFYTGEFISAEENVRRLDDFFYHFDIYPHEHEKNFKKRGVKEENAPATIDAKKAGNETRFINHSCEPNCTSEKVDPFQRINPLFVVVMIYSKRNIAAGEELTLNYGWEPIHMI